MVIPVLCSLPSVYIMTLNAIACYGNAISMLKERLMVKTKKQSINLKQKHKIMENNTKPSLMINGRLRKPNNKPLQYDNFEDEIYYAKGVHASFHNQINPKLHKHTKGYVKKKRPIGSGKPKYGSIKKKGKVTDTRLMTAIWKLPRHSH